MEVAFALLFALMCEVVDIVSARIGFKASESTEEDEDKKRPLIVSFDIWLAASAESKG